METTDAGLINSIAIFMEDGGSFMWIIFALWVTGIAICIERFLKLSIYDIDGSSLMNEVQKAVVNNDIKEAIKFCSNSRAVLCNVLKNGLKRASQGPEQIQNAIDASALESIPKVESRIHYLSMLANLSTLLGLLGTIFGLIASFEAVGAADPAQKAEILAKGISKAMNTTAMGLISAISLIFFHSLINTKAEKIIGDMDEYSVKLLDLVGTKKIIEKS